MQTQETDCLVIGDGLAALAYALEAAKGGLSCTVLSMSPAAHDNNSSWAQGGIIHKGGELLRQDIIAATHHKSNLEAVDQLVRLGPAVVDELLLGQAQVPFHRDAKGQFKLTKEAAHSEARILFAADRTGHAIMSALIPLAEAQPNIQFLRGHVAVDLLTLSHNSLDYQDRFQPLTVIGAYVFDSNSGNVQAIVARSTILATGGAGQIFRHSTNTPYSFGHGIAMAYRVGARVMDMEFVQFHPTVFFKNKGRTFLVSEAVRGEGGVLVDAAGNAFMEKYHPDGSLAPRDVVGRAIATELVQSGDLCVYIDTEAIKPETFRTRFPYIFDSCQAHGITPGQDPIPVVPAAHYLCGGVFIDLAGQTSVRGLKAIGETATNGLHGSNRLASTSLLECLVVGMRAAQEDLANIAPKREVRVKDWETPGEIADDKLLKQDISMLQKTMWNYVGLIRTHQRLKRASHLLYELKREIDRFYADCQLSLPLLNLRNGIQVGLLTTYAAFKNKKSDGCHYRTD